MMRALGILPKLIDRRQSHLPMGSNVRRHYMLHDYADEKRAAWAAMDEKVAALIALRDNA